MVETDIHGIVTEQIASSAKSTLKGKRRRFRPGSPLPLDTLPHEWHGLLTKWLKRGGRSRWETLVKDAGTTHLALAESLLIWLLRHGWASVEEERRHGSWWPTTVELREISALRAKLGLPDEAAITQHWNEKRIQLESLLDEALTSLIQTLDEMPATRALR